ncbi:hypothetical protein J3459_008372 [Metarhizium acridum]|nr:hypothetical protein J3459_008372 [Metarhizium acridum]
MSDVDQAIADGRVPPDVTRAILLESKDRPAVVGILIVTILTFLVVCGRVASRTFIVRRFGYDDGLAVISLSSTLVAHIIYTTALLLCRISGLAFYYRICGVHHGFLIAIRAVFGVIVAGFMPQLFLLIFHCQPVTGLWPYGWEPGWERYTCLQWGIGVQREFVSVVVV